MPSRHSKNAGDRHHFSYREREGCGYGTQSVRFGADSQLPFGNCALCLQPAKEPMATPSGYIYCRECILEYLLTKTKDLKRYREAYNLQQEKLKEKEAENRAKYEDAAVESFVQKQTGVGMVSKNVDLPAPSVLTIKQSMDQSSNALVVSSKSSLAVTVIPTMTTELGKRGQIDSEESEKKRFMSKMAHAVDTTTLEEHREILKRTSFWLPTHTPEHVEKVLAAPESRPRSPMSNEPLRAKDLIPVRFTLDSNEGGKKIIICAVSRKEINCQPTVLLSNSGQVMLKSSVEKFALPTMTCPISGKKFRKSEIIELVHGSSGFSASGQVEAHKYQPVMM